MRTEAVINAQLSDEPEILRLAHDWRDGKLRRVHPGIAQRFNRALVAAGEAPVPFRRATDASAPSFTDLIRREYERAGRVQNDPIRDREAA